MLIIYNIHILNNVPIVRSHTNMYKLIIVAICSPESSLCLFLTRLGIAKIKRSSVDVSVPIKRDDILVS